MTALLSQAATVEFAEYHPGYVIEAVNALQPLGKDKALEEIESYLAATPPGEDQFGLFWVLRVLFDVPEAQGFPEVRIGQPSIPPPDDSAQLPRYPIVIIQDVPLLAIQGYFVGGFPQPVADHIAYFRSHGTIRAQPLSPSSDTASIKDEFAQKWQAAYGDAHLTEATTTIDAQLTRMNA